MKILMVWPEATYTMAMHTKLAKRWAYFVEVGSYLKNKGYKVKALDCLTPKISHGEVLKDIAKNNYDLVIFISRIEGCRGIHSLAPKIKELDNKIDILVYGDVANYAPNFFKKDYIDAVVESGDWECAIEDFIKYKENLIDEDEVCGVSFKKDNEWSKAKKGKELKNCSWSFPDVSPELVDKDTYFSIADSEKELTLTVSRGCPFGCKFCPAVITFNNHDRRKKVREVVDYIKKNKNLTNNFKLFSPTFTLDEKWVLEFCDVMIKEKVNVRWSMTTRPDCLQNEEVVKALSEAGCYKIAMGVETLDKDSINKLGKYDADDIIAQTRNSIQLATKYNIKAKALLMLGICGQTGKNIKETFRQLVSWGADIRAASYSPRQNIKEMDKDNVVTLEYIESLDKMTYQDRDIDGVSREDYLRLIYNTEDFEKILEDA